MNCEKCGAPTMQSPGGQRWCTNSKCEGSLDQMQRDAHNRALVDDGVISFKDVEEVYKKMQAQDGPFEPAIMPEIKR